MKILIVPDSFKGSLSSNEVCQCIKSGIEQSYNDCEIVCLPFSDGGEGFADCMTDFCAGKKIYTKCRDIYSNEINGFIADIGNTAIIESATASGLQKRKNVMQASSYGTGELIKFAYENGFENIILGLGGTGCCDGGAGALTALGAKFYDENHNVIKFPKASDLNYIFGADFRNILKGINITYACDVENTYFGKNGAAYVFAPQKGARKTDVEEIDCGLKRLNAFFKNDISNLQGGGAGGGICAGLYAVYNGIIKSGFDIMSEYSSLEEKISQSDIIITGEGKTDKQTLMGKLPFKISSLAQKHNKKCIIISGIIENVSLGDKMISLVDENTDKETAISNAREILIEKSKSVLQ